MNVAVRLRPTERTFPAYLVAGALVAGALTVAVATRVGGPLAPMLVVALPLAPAVILAALARPWLAIGFVFLSIPIGSTGLPNLPLQVVQGMILVAAVVLLMRRLAEGRVPLDWAVPLWWFLAFVAWAVVALPSAADHPGAVRQTLLFGGELLFAAVVVSVCDTPAKVRKALAVLLVVASGIGVSTLAGGANLRSQFGGSVVSGRAQGVFHQPNELGTFCAVTLLAAVGLAMGGATRRSRRAAAAIAAVLTVPLMLSLSRGAWIGVTCGVFGLAVMLPEARRRLLSIGVPVLFLALVFGSFAPSSPEVQVVSERAKSIVGERNPYDDRPHIWAEGRREFLADPWTGQGPGSFPVVAARSGSETVTFYPQHAHDLLLTFAAEVGLPGVLLAVAFFGSAAGVVRRALRRLTAAGRTRDAALLAGLASAMIAILGQGVIDYSLRSAVIFTTITGVLGCMLAMARNTSSS